MTPTAEQGGTGVVNVRTLGRSAAARGLELALEMEPFALSLLILRLPRSEGPVTWVTGTLYTIPSLALFALLVPSPGLPILTAETGLVS